MARVYQIRDGRRQWADEAGPSGAIDIIDRMCWRSDDELLQDWQRAQKRLEKPAE